MSLRLFSHLEEKTAMNAQEKVDGATGEGNTSKVSNGMEAKASCFIIALKWSKLWSIVFIALKTNIWWMSCLSSSLDNFGPKDYFFARKLCKKNRGAYVDDQNWHGCGDRSDRNA